MMIRQMVVFCIFQSFMYARTSKVILKLYMYKKPVHTIYTGFDNFLHYSLQGFKIYAVLMYFLLVPHRFLVTGDAMTTIAYNSRLGVSTARQIILDVCTALWDALASIHMPVLLKLSGKPLLMIFLRGGISQIVLGPLTGSTS